ncbi:MAG: DUF2169 domain-containing protein, partial [Myxococcales bacterium]
MSIPTLPRRKKPQVPILNTTPFPAFSIPWQVRPPNCSLTVVVKGTFSLDGDGPVVVHAEQTPPNGDMPYDDDPKASLFYPSDFVVFKPAADLLLVGHAVPSQPDATVGAVEFRCGSFHRRLAVFGDRRWGTFGLDGKPTPFQRMPLRYERAMGGPLSEANPVGRGYGTHMLLPNLERPEQLVSSPGDRPAPACFGPIAPSWPPRKGKLGTYDGRWLAERWPYFPADVDWTHTQSAPR